MVLSCDLTIDGIESNEFVLLRNALYLLPDSYLADVTPTLVWCNVCNGFRDGETIQSESELQKLLTDTKSGTLDQPYDFIFDTAKKVERFQRKIMRSIHYRSLRRTPPKCLECGSASIEPIDVPLNETFDDKLGRQVSYSQSFASTSIDHWLYIYDIDGRLIGEMSRVCPDTNEFIDDDYSPEKLLKLMDATGDAG